MTPTIEMPEFIQRHGDGAFVLDCREAYEYVAGHVPGAVLAPMSRFGAILGDLDLPRDQEINVICQSGNRSRAITDLLIHLGFRAVSVNGGTFAWRMSGNPVVTGSSAA